MVSFLIRKAIISGFVALLLLPGAARAQTRECIDYVDDRLQFRGANGKLSPVERVAEYIAVIDQRDLRNSRGTRLTDYRAILQQDRANVHNSGRADRFDEIVEDFDTYFTTLNRRKLLSTAPYYFDCWMSSETVTSIQNDIRSGQVAGIVSVMVIRLPNGNLAITITIAG